MTILSNITALSDVAKLEHPAPDAAALEAALARQGNLTKPPKSLGRLEELAVFMAGWQGVEKPQSTRAQALIFAGNHGVCAQGVSAFPPEVTVQMVANFEAGGAAINQLCKAAGAELSVVAIDLDRPTADISETAAMTEAETLDAMKRGAEAVDPEADVLLLGEMGIGNTTIASALAHGAFGGVAADWVGRGTGADDAGVARKVAIVEKAVALHVGSTGIAQLATLGGREQAAIAGAVLEARARRIPVLLDGFICTASVAPLYKEAPDFLAHCIAGHVSREPGHQKLLAAMGKEPILALDMALGEGSGAAVALNILHAALACHNGMATFAEAGVSGG